MIKLDDLEFANELNPNDIDDILREFNEFYDLDNKTFAISYFKEVYDKGKKISKISATEIYYNLIILRALKHGLLHEQKTTVEFIHETFNSLILIGIGFDEKTCNKIHKTLLADIDNSEEFAHLQKQLQLSLKDLISQKTIYTPPYSFNEDILSTAIKNVISKLTVSDFIGIIDLNISHLEKAFNSKFLLNENSDELMATKGKTLFRLKQLEDFFTLLNISKYEKNILNFFVFWFNSEKIYNKTEKLKYFLNIKNKILFFNSLTEDKITIDDLNSERDLKILRLDLLMTVNTSDEEADLAITNKFKKIIQVCLKGKKENLQELASILMRLENVDKTRNKTELNYEDLNYIENLDILDKIIKNNEKQDILIWGDTGTGKTELIKALGKKNNKTIHNINAYNIHGSLRNLTVVKEIGNFNNSNIFLIENIGKSLLMEDIKATILNLLEKKTVTIIWVFNDIENINKLILNRFDTIIEVKNMPFEARYKLAKKLLGDNAEDSLDFKIAQTLHTPADIKSAIEWANKTGDFSWRNIIHKISSYDRVLSKSLTNKDDITITVIPPNSKLTMNDYAGYEYIKTETLEFLDILKNPMKYKKLNAKLPKGVLFAGPPGVGKTLFANCLSGFADTNLISINCSELAVNTKNIKKVFDKAKSIAPCIIFLDEIDVLATNIVKPNGEIDTTKQKLLDSLLVEIDGFEKYSGVLVIGATHRSENLDPAILRNGRLGKTIYFRTPNKEDRIAILKKYINDIPHEDEINYEKLSKVSNTFSSADLSQAVNDAAILAGANNLDKVSEIHLITAIDKIFYGTRMDGFPISEKEKVRTAIHEAGHALISQKNKRSIQRATIRPHQRFLGMVQQYQEEGDYGFNKETVKIQVEILLAGMIAEEVILGDFKSGNFSDLKTANELIRKYFLTGMSNSTRTFHPGFSISEKLLGEIEKESQDMLDTCYKNVQNWISENKELILKFAQELIDKRCLDLDEIEKWFKEHANIILKENVVILNENISADEMVSNLLNQHSS